MSEDARPRIALIDDDAAFLALMRDLLAGFEGYAVLVCREADRAAAFIQQERPDLILLDVRIGGGPKGWAILERLARDPATRSIPVIICSVAAHELEDRAPLLRRRGVDVLPKPFDLDHLMEKVRAGLADGRRKRRLTAG